MDCVCPRLRKNVAGGTQGTYDSTPPRPGLTSGASWAPQVPRALCPRRLLRRGRAQVTLIISSLSGVRPDQVPLAGRHLGAIAQLEERLVCIQKARGSSPLSSTGQQLVDGIRGRLGARRHGVPARGRSGLAGANRNARRRVLGTASAARPHVRTQWLSAIASAICRTLACQIPA